MPKEWLKAVKNSTRYDPLVSRSPRQRRRMDEGGEWRSESAFSAGTWTRTQATNWSLRRLTRAWPWFVPKKSISYFHRDILIILSVYPLSLLLLHQYYCYHSSCSLFIVFIIPYKFFSIGIAVAIIISSISISILRYFTGSCHYLWLWLAPVLPLPSSTRYHPLPLPSPWSASPAAHAW